MGILLRLRNLRNSSPNLYLHLFSLAFLFLSLYLPTSLWIFIRTHLDHRWQTQGPWAKSGLAPCFYPAAVPSSCLTVKAQLHLYSPNITFGPLKATARLIWPPMKMSLTPLTERILESSLGNIYILSLCNSTKTKYSSKKS